MSEPLAGRVVAVIGDGEPLHRAVAVTLAEAGADVALGTIARGHEFAVASIANEIWAIGRQHFFTALDADNPEHAAAFADETWDRLKHCEALVWVPENTEPVPLDELSHEEWEVGLDRGLTAPFLAAQAFGRLMERSGAGRIVLVAPSPTGNAATAAAAGGLQGLVNAINSAWHGRGVEAFVQLPAPVVFATAAGVVAHIAS